MRDVALHAGEGGGDCFGKTDRLRCAQHCGLTRHLKDALRIVLHQLGYREGVTKAITVRLDARDHEALTRQADQLRVSPRTLARMLIHAGLNDGDHSRRDANTAIARLVRRSRQRPPGDAVTLVGDARAALGSDG